MTWEEFRALIDRIEHTEDESIYYDKEGNIFAKTERYVFEEGGLLALYSQHIIDEYLKNNT